MIKVSASLVLLLMIAEISSQSTFLIHLACKEVEYDYHVLALTWPNEYCSEYSCSRNWKEMWDGKNLIIHGFWPSSTDLSYLNCLSQNPYDPYCFRNYSFNQKLFTSAELVDLNKYWPELGAIKNFWGYEWAKHGTCYLHIIKDEFRSNLTDAQIFKAYFTSTLNKVKTLNISLKPGTTFSTKVDLATAIKLHSSEFYAICGEDNELDELRICYDVYQVPGQEYIMTCPNSKDKKQCKFPIVVK